MGQGGEAVKRPGEVVADFSPRQRRSVTVAVRFGRAMWGNGRSVPVLSSRLRVMHLDDLHVYRPHRCELIAQRDRLEARVEPRRGT